MYERISNIYYPPGAIVRINSTKEHLGTLGWFLNNRPLIVLQPQTQMFDSLLCIPCGSKDRPGIEISLWDYQHNCWLSGHQYSMCFPYNAHNIRVNMIDQCIGHLDPWTFKAVKEAFLYHMGMSDVVPPYMREIHEQMYETKFSMGTEANTQLGSKHYMISRKEAAARGIVLDPPIPNPGTPYFPGHARQPQPQGVDDGDEDETIRRSPYYLSDPVPDNDPIDDNGPAEEDGEFDDGTVENGGSLPVTPLPLDPPRKAKPARRPRTDYKSLAAKLPDEVQIRVCIGMPQTQDIDHYKLPTNTARSMALLKDAIMNSHNIRDDSAVDAINEIAGKLGGRDKNWKFLSEFEKYVAVMYGTPGDLKITAKSFEQRVVHFCRNYGITHEWACTRRQIPNRTYIRDVMLEQKKKKYS